jgi:hypothetical protein
MNTMDVLCNQLTNSKIEYDEYEELKNSLINLFNLNNTIERYQRYITHITLWEVNGVCIEYIKELILEFFNNHNINKLNLSRTIDLELINILN